MIYREHVELGGFSGPAIILRKHDYEALSTMAGGAKSPACEKSLWLDFKHGAVCTSNSNGVVLVQHGAEERDWTECGFLPFPLQELKPVLASIKGKDAAQKTIVGCLVFIQTGPLEVSVCGLIAEDYKEEDFKGDADELPGVVSVFEVHDTLGGNTWRPWDCLTKVKTWHRRLPPFAVDSAIAKTLTKASVATKGGPMVCKGELAHLDDVANSHTCVSFSVMSEKGDGSTWAVLQGTLRPLARK